MSNIIIPNKNTGDQFTANEFNDVKTAVNSKSDQSDLSDLQTQLNTLIADAPDAYNTLVEIANKLSADDGALAGLLSAVANRLPYTGATGDVDVSPHDISANGGHFTGDVGAHGFFTSSYGGSVTAGSSVFADLRVASLLADRAIGLTVARNGTVSWFIGASATDDKFNIKIDGITPISIDRATGTANFSNSPTAPTPTAGDNSTKVATTGFVTAAVGLSVPQLSPATTGTALSFTADKVYGSKTIPETGNITANITGAQLGVTVMVIHNSDTTPTFDSKFKKLSGSGSYVSLVINYIFCQYIASDEIIYSINQRS